MRRFALVAVALCACTQPHGAVAVDLAVPLHDLGTLSCAQSLDAYCAQAPCIRDLATATAPPACVNDMGPRIHATVSCAGYVVVYGTYVDSGTGWVYDATTGALVAAFWFANTNSGCLGGPAALDLRACGGDTFFCSPAG